MEGGFKITREKLTNIVLPLKGTVSIDKFTIDNGFMSVELINYGATITAIYLPDKTGVEGDILLGFEDPLDYLKKRNPYLGATIGRYGNIISGARFSVCGQVFYTSMNSPPDTYHGGIQGLDKKMWDARIEDNALVMTHKSYDLDQGFPGDLCVKAKFILTPENQLIIIYSAWSNQKTPVNILNECYFNLAGHATGRAEVLEHDIKINSNYYVVTTEDGRPTGEVDEVESTFYDLREILSVKDVVESEEEFNDHVSFCFGGEGLKNVAYLRHSESGRSLTIYTDQPCITLKLAQDFKKLNGKENAIYKKISGICIQTGNLPDATRHKLFPSPILQPGDEYRHTIVWKFRVEGLTDLDEIQEELEPNIELDVKTPSDNKISKAEEETHDKEAKPEVKPEAKNIEDTQPEVKYFEATEIEQHTTEEGFISVHESTVKEITPSTSK